MIFKLLNIEHGVFAASKITSGEYIIEYKGDVIFGEEITKREKDYAMRNLGCFMYFFKHNEKKYW